MTESAARPVVEPLPDGGFKRVLCVVAHPDDVEYGTSGAVASWVARGVEVAYLLLTSGEAGMQRPPSDVGPLRAAEQRAACDVVGVRQLQILDHPDGMLVYGLDLRRDIARVIRQFRPDVVVTGSWEVDFIAGLTKPTTGLWPLARSATPTTPGSFPSWPPTRALPSGGRPGC